MRRHKFNAKAVEDDGHRFDSKLEHKFYKQLLIRKSAGEVVFFLRQPVFHLPGGVKYKADYQVFNADGTCSFVDVKGVETSEFKIKKKMVEAMYPITVEVVTKI